MEELVLALRTKEENIILEGQIVLDILEKLEEKELRVDIDSFRQVLEGKVPNLKLLDGVENYKLDIEEKFEEIRMTKVLKGQDSTLKFKYRGLEEE